MRCDCIVIANFNVKIAAKLVDQHVVHTTPNGTIYNRQTAALAGCHGVAGGHRCHWQLSHHGQLDQSEDRVRSYPIVVSLVQQIASSRSTMVKMACWRQCMVTLVLLSCYASCGTDGAGMGT